LSKEERGGDGEPELQSGGGNNRQCLRRGRNEVRGGSEFVRLDERRSDETQ